MGQSLSTSVKTAEGQQAEAGKPQWTMLSLMPLLSNNQSTSAKMTFIPSTVEDPIDRMGGSASEAKGPAAGTVPTVVMPSKEDLASTTNEVDYLELPQPVRYEELQKENIMSLRPDVFEGMRFDFTKPLNQNFSLSHSIAMGNEQIQTPNPDQIYKMPASTYEFGANLIGNQGMMIGRMVHDGRFSGRVKYDLTDNVSVKLQSQLDKENRYSQTMFDLDFKGLDWNGQLKVGNSQFVGVNYFQSVTNNLALGGEAFYLGSQRKSGIGLAMRHQSDPGIATCQIANTGMLSCTYHHKVSEKVFLASEFMWNWNLREATAAVGYDYILRQCRLRGKVDSSGVITAFLEERLNVGVNFVLSAEVDHFRKDYKFGFGMNVGME